MKIRLDPMVALKLETACLQTPNEISGFGFVEIDREHNDFVVYEVLLLDHGTYGWTEIDQKKLAELQQRPDFDKMRLWWHRHPLGSGRPGPENWSGTDDNTARNAPLGTIPELLHWSISIVRTPLGWVGRYDTYGPKGKTWHVEVTPNFALDLSREIAIIDSLKPRTASFFPSVKVRQDYDPESGFEIIDPGAQTDAYQYLDEDQVEQFEEDLVMCDEDEFNSKWYEDEEGFWHSANEEKEQGAETTGEEEEQPQEAEVAADNGRPFWEGFLPWFWHK